MWEARERWFRARLFPWLIGFAGLTLALIQLSSEVPRLLRSGLTGREGRTAQERSLDQQRTVSIAAWILGFFAAIWLLGFPIAVPVSILLYLKAGAHESWPTSIALAFIGWLSFYGIFDHLLHVPFPKGAIFTWLEI
ncbi:MAG TPA: tripartite tricarboxylate transporter TctB family protein [Candidatus Binatia bacterium]|nr:tripartite tricarboxylate transporter TctB family protein [Candidatus Binatia bacterium]